MEDEKTTLRKHFEELGLRVSFTKTIMTLLNDGKECLQVNIKSDDTNGERIFYIEQLSECKTGKKNPINTKDIMEKLKQSAKELGITRLELSDKSTKIICGKYVSLAPYYILKYGQSWYNSLGFVSKNYEDEKTHNKIIRQKTIGYYTEKICDSILKPEVNRLKQIIEKPQISVFDGFDRYNAQLNSIELKTIISKLESEEFQRKYSNMTLEKFVNEIWDGTTNYCEHIDVLSYLIELIFNSSYGLDESDKLAYDRELYYEVGKTGGSRKIQKKRTAKKRRKYRKSHKRKKNMKSYLYH